MMSDNIQPIIGFENPANQRLPDLVAASIKRAIQEGRLESGQRLPSEPELAEQLGVSRTTLRDAVRILVNDRALERRRGVGTFVTQSPLVNLSEGLEYLTSTSEVIRSQGYEPGTSASSWELLPADAKLAQVLDVPMGTSLLHLSRTRTANEQPVIHCEEYVPAELVPAEVISSQAGDWSLYQLLKSQQLGVSTALCKIVPVVADAAVSRRLRVPQAYPLLLLRQTHFCDDHRPVLYCENYHNCSIIEFHVIRRS